MNLKPLLALSALGVSGLASAQLFVTEYQYDGGEGEFFELTNLGSTTIDLNGSTADDDSRLNPGPIVFAGLAPIAPGGFLILTDRPASEFRAAFSLPASVQVFTKTEPGFGRADELNIFSSTGELQVRFAYGDVPFPGTPRTQGFSANVPLAEINLTSTSNDAAGSVASVLGDEYDTYASSGTQNLANPGIYTPFAPVPEPATMAVLGLGAVALLKRRRKG